MHTRRHPEPRIPPDSRSVQILYRISGMLNESNRSHIGDGTFQNSLRCTNGNRQCQAIFANVTETLHKISLAASPHHLAKCVICIFANLCVFHEFVKTRKTQKWRFSRICKIVKNSKKFSYTWFISPRIIYCLVPRQPPIWGWWFTHGGTRHEKCTLFVTWRFI